MKGFRNSVPAIFRSSQTGSQPLTANDRSASVMGTLATVASSVTSVRKGLGLELAPLADPFRRSLILRRSPPTRAQAPLIATAIRLAYGKAKYERGEKPSIEKVNQATQVTPAQNTKGEKPQKGLREKLND